MSTVAVEEAIASLLRAALWYGFGQEPVDIMTIEIDRLTVLVGKLQGALQEIAEDEMAARDAMEIARRVLQTSQGGQ